MHTLNVHLLLSLLMISSTDMRGFPRSFLDEMMQEMDQFHERMEKHFSQIHQEMRDHFAHTSYKESEISILPKEDACEIIFSNITLKDKNLDAQFDQEKNNLMIKSDGYKASIYANHRGRYTQLRVECRQHLIREPEHKEAQGHSINSSFYTSEVIAGDIELEHAHIEYEAELHQLKISIPFRKKLLTKIPVNIKEPKDGK